MDKEGKIVLLSAFFLVIILVVGMVMAAPKANKACRDGIDNDGDGYIDWPNDPGCANKNDNSELNPNVECDDGIDNDGDNAIDMADEGCSSPNDNDETNCGDSVCEGGETPVTCPADCGIPDSCSDTDGGLIEWIFGTVSGFFSGSPYSNADFCVDNTTLIEYSCLGNYVYSWNISCTGNYTGCDSGECY
jgi:hypothetical protein